MSTAILTWRADRLGGLPCRVLLPPSYAPDQRFPLVVALHGSMERGTDNVAQLKNGVDEVFGSAGFQQHFPCIVVAPQLPPGWNFGGSWYPPTDHGEQPGQRALLDLVDELSGRRTVDETRVYGVGFSMGAIGLWDVIGDDSPFAAVVLVAGDVDDDRARAARRPLWAFHDEDDTVVDKAGAVRGVAVAKAAGVDARLTLYRGVGHLAWTRAYREDALWPWLFAARRP